MPTPPSFVAESFAEAWPELEERLRRSLAARGVPAQDRDDVVQETALRVYRAWPTLDHQHSTWPFVITVAVNFWRDVMRERTGRIAQVHPVAVIEATADLDVERDVLARQELASVGVAMRALGAEQRRLLFASEEFADTVRPLLPAERVARMRVRRQLARAVGRASAAVFVLWLRRPGRTSGVVATAYAGALAATVLTAPAMVTMPAVSALPPAQHAHVQAAKAGTAHASTAATDTASHGTRITPTTLPLAAPQLPAVSPAHRPAPGTDPQAKVCTPEQPPVDPLEIVLQIGSIDPSGQGGGPGDQAEVTTTPPVKVGASSNGCVGVG